MEEKVPRQGYILTAPGTSEGERLRQCWVTPDRPERFAVPYTYVDACKISNTVIKQHFVENGQPILFYLHPSIDSIGARAALIQRITVRFHSSAFSKIPLLTWLFVTSILEETLRRHLKRPKSSWQTLTQTYFNISARSTKGCPTNTSNPISGSNTASMRMKSIIRL